MGGKDRGQLVCEFEASQVYNSNIQGYTEKPCLKELKKIKENKEQDLKIAVTNMIDAFKEEMKQSLKKSMKTQTNSRSE